MTNATGWPWDMPGPDIAGGPPTGQCFVYALSCGDLSDDWQANEPWEESAAGAKTRTYIGATSNLGSRLVAHESGVGARFTKMFPPERVWFVHSALTMEDALSLEKGMARFLWKLVNRETHFVYSL